jgi:hypothetical protein
LKETVIEREDKYFGPVSRSIPNRKGNVELLQGIADGTRGSASANYHCDIIRREGKEMGQQEKKKKKNRQSGVLDRCSPSVAAAGSRRPTSPYYLPAVCLALIKTQKESTKGITGIPWAHVTALTAPMACAWGLSSSSSGMTASLCGIVTQAPAVSGSRNFILISFNNGELFLFPSYIM